MFLKKKESDSNTSNYLIISGIHGTYEDESIDYTTIEKEGYQEINTSHLGQLDMLMQQIPGLVTNGISYHGTYRVYFDKSLGVLQQAKQGNGFVRGNIVEFGTNNHIKGDALWKKASDGPLVFSSVFSIMSLITGQYFLSEINDKLSVINKKIEEILQFLEMEKTSELVANEQYLQQTIRNVNYIKSNELLKQAYINQLQQIKKDSLANVIFYSASYKIKKEELSLKKKSKGKEILPIMSDIGNAMLCYKHELLSYCLAYYLEIIISEVFSSEFLNEVQKEMKSRMNEYKKDVKEMEKDYKDFLEEAKAFKANEMIEAIGKVVVGVGTKVFFGSFTLGYTVADAANEKSDDKKAKAKKEIMEQANKLLEQCKDNKPFNRITDSLKQYDYIINKSKLEFIRTEDKAFIKFVPNEIEEV